jgi:PEP-CTERM motif
MHPIVRWVAVAAFLCLPAFTARAIPVDSLKHSRPAADDASPVPGSFIAVTADTPAAFASQQNQSIAVNSADFSGILKAQKQIQKVVGVTYAHAGPGGGMYSPVPVPEPATLLLIAAGSLLTYRRR